MSRPVRSRSALYSEPLIGLDRSHDFEMRDRGSAHGSGLVRLRGGGPLTGESDVLKSYNKIGPLNIVAYMKVPWPIGSATEA